MTGADWLVAAIFVGIALLVVWAVRAKRRGRGCCGRCAGCTEGCRSGKHRGRKGKACQHCDRQDPGARP